MFNKINEYKIADALEELWIVFRRANKYIDEIKTETLGTVMDRIFSENDLRSSTGGIGLLTQDVVTRIDLTTEAFLMALTPFINEKIWKDEVTELERE